MPNTNTINMKLFTSLLLLVVALGNGACGRQEYSTAPRDRLLLKDIELNTDSSTFQSSHCPPGFTPTVRNESSYANKTSCKCLKNLKSAVKCVNFTDPASAYILGGHCMTYDKASDTTAISHCRFSCQVKESLLDGRTDFYLLPNNFSDLEEAMCGKMNRQGYLCSQCHPGYRPPAYSYSPECVPCDLTRKELALNWMKYLALAVLPQSAIFLSMAVFKVGLTRPPYVTMIQVFQALTTPMYLQSVVRLLSCWTYKNNMPFTIVLRLLIIFYGFFNLEFFRFLNPEFCLNLDIMQLLLLDYASAFWPLLLIIGVYLLIDIYMRGFKPVIWMWKPVSYCLNRCKREWHPKSSLIETFASFLLLSWMKLLSISSSLITILCVSNVSRDGAVTVDCTHLYNSPNMKFFSQEHLIFGTTALAVSLIFIVFPLVLLILYPCRLFHRLLNWCGFHSQALHMFMDCFEGNFQDGSNGTTDYRWFASCYHVLRILMILLGSLWSRFFFPIVSVVLIAFAIMVYTIQPYKKAIHNVFDTALLLILAAFYASHIAVTTVQFTDTEQYFTFSVGLTFAIGVMPLVISLGYGLWWCIKVKLRGVQLYSRTQQWCTWCKRRHASLEESLPESMDDPNDYHEMVDLVPLHQDEYPDQQPYDIQ